MKKFKEKMDNLALRVLLPLSNRNAWGETEADGAKGSLNLITVIVLVMFTVGMVTLVVFFMNDGMAKLKAALNQLLGIVPTVTP